PQDGLAQNLNQFFKDILTSPLIDQLAEYDTPTMKIGHGQFIGTATLTTPSPGSSIADSAIRTALRHQLQTNHAFPAPDQNTLYFIYLPPGVKVIQGGGSSCQAFCGYHDAISGQIFYAVMPFAGCPGCL